MSEATPLASEQITQEDRVEGLRFIPRNSIAGQDRAGVLAGKYDDAAAIQAFARHRIAALSVSPAPSGQGVSGEALPPNAVDDQGFSDAECNAVLIDGYARDADRRGWRATGDALRRAAGFIRGYDALTAKAAPAPSCAPGEVERAARAMCVADGLDPDEHIVGGQATGFEDFGPLWQAEERSDGQLGLTNYKRLATAALSPQGLDAKEGGKPCDFYLGDCRRCGKRADRDNQNEPCTRPGGPFAPTTATPSQRLDAATVERCAETALRREVAAVINEMSRYMPHATEDWRARLLEALA